LSTCGIKVGSKAAVWKNSTSVLARCLLPHTSNARKEAEQRRLEALFAEYQTWIEETMTTEDKPYIRMVAMLVGAAV
jgi:hypothetical protein